MRLDKYLQITGLIKRRALANEACKLGLVKVNGVAAKPTREIAVDDLIDISLARREISIKVLQLIQGNSLKKTIRHEFFNVIKDVEKTVVDDFWQDNPDE
jgi:ribosome-associated heat shock protein Hsp15